MKNEKCDTSLCGDRLTPRKNKKKVESAVEKLIKIKMSVSVRSCGV